MAGDWIMVDHELPDKDEVAGIFERTGVEIATICGRLMLLWSYADRMTTDGVLPKMGTRTLCVKFGGDAEFWKAVCEVGWLVIDEAGATIPDFIERFGQSAKARKLDARRKQSERSQIRWNGQIQDTTRTDAGHESDAGPDSQRPPEPRTENREPRIKIPVPAGVFSKLKDGDLRNTAKLLGLLGADAPEAHRRYVLGAAERALQIGNKPVALFVRIVKAGDFHLIDGDQDARAQARLKALERATGPPATDLAASLAAAFKPTDDP